MQKYVYEFTEGGKDKKELLGGKGANLAEMTRLGLPVPPGSPSPPRPAAPTSTDGAVPPELRVQVTRALGALEDRTVASSATRRPAAGLGPLRSEVLDAGHDGDRPERRAERRVGPRLAAVSGDARFAWDSYRRLIPMFGKTVLGIDGELFAEASTGSSASAACRGRRPHRGRPEELVETYRKIVHEETGRPFPQDPREQLDLAIVAVFDSWNTDRARIYRRRERIPHDLGTAVNVCTMVFGNLGADSGTGVCFTRDPATGKQGVYGDYLPNAQGEDVVAGIRNTLTLADLAERDPAPRSSCSG